MWLFQLQPKIFLNRFDGFTWIFMKTGLHQWLIDNPQGWTLLDTLFYAMPLIFFLSNNVYKVASATTAFLMLLINWIYIQCYTLYPTNSIEAHTAWLLFPIIFLVSNPATFKLLLEGLRYFFFVRNCISRNMEDHYRSGFQPGTNEWCFVVPAC